MRRGRRNPHNKSENDRTIERLIRSLVLECKSPSEVLELYYWSKEPGLIEVIRGIAAMPEEARASIEAFIALAGDAKSASAELDGRGVLTLASGEATRTAALARYLAANDADDLSRLPH
jgi:hypothetical protein